MRMTRGSPLRQHQLWQQPRHKEALRNGGKKLLKLRSGGVGEFRTTPEVFLNFRSTFSPHETLPSAAALPHRPQQHTLLQRHLAFINCQTPDVSLHFRSLAINRSDSCSTAGSVDTFRVQAHPVGLRRSECSIIQQVVSKYNMKVMFSTYLATSY